MKKREKLVLGIFVIIKIRDLLTYASSKLLSFRRLQSREVRYVNFILRLRNLVTLCIDFFFAILREQPRNTGFMVFRDYWNKRHRYQIFIEF